MWSVKCEVWSVKEAVRSEKCGVWSVKCGVWSLKFGVRRVQCAVWGVECRGKDTVGTGCLWTIGHLFLGNFRRRLARVYVIYYIYIYDIYIYILYKRLLQLISLCRIPLCHVDDRSFWVLLLGSQAKTISAPRSNCLVPKLMGQCPSRKNHPHFVNSQCGMWLWKTHLATRINWDKLALFG